jgi:AcrR family transcriptional regulator
MAQPAHDRSPQLSFESIVDAAVALIEADGLGSLTMRRLAGSLGCSPMALYRHVATKEDLLRAIAEHYLGDLELPNTDGLTWQETVVEVTTTVHRAFIAHPQLAPILAVQHVDALAVFRATELVLHALRSAGLDNREAARALDTITSYAVGATQRKAEQRRGSTADAARLTRIRELPPESFPTVRELVGELVTVDFEHSFEDGLQLVIDGIERRVEATSGGRPAQEEAQ